MATTKFGYTPKIGDKVIITKSHNNFASNMEYYVGRVFTIKTIDRYGGVEFVENEMNDDHNLNDWHWSYGQGHFEPYSPAEKKTLKLKINF